MWRSVPQTLAVSTAMRTSLGPISGTGTSRISMPGAAFVFTNARIVLLILNLLLCGLTTGSHARQTPYGISSAVAVTLQRMRRLLAISIFVAAGAVAQTPAAPKPAVTPDAQEAPFAQDGPQYSITARSTLVLVPALVKTKAGQLVYTLKANDFVLTDDGVPQPLRLEEDNGGQPLAMVRSASRWAARGATHLHDYRNLGLGASLDNMLGGIPHKVAIVAFDSTPTLVHRFSSHLDSISGTLATQEAGDSGAATLDAVSFAIDQLRPVPTTYRRAILLLSETKDNEQPHQAGTGCCAAVSDTNTAIYSVALFFQQEPTKRGEASKLKLR